MENTTQENFKKPFKGPMLLCILDGFGLNENEQGNAVLAANTPVIDGLMNSCANSQLLTHGKAVGLPEGQMGNSEVGHMTIGSGRVILQNLDLIREALKTDMAAYPAWSDLIKSADTSSKIHLVGLLSDGGVHSHVDHLVALCEKLDALGKHVVVHGVLDGRDTAPQVGVRQIQAFLSRVEHLNNVCLADVCGRFYAMDRDKNWDRVQRAYDMYTKGTAGRAANLADAVAFQHSAGTTDEFIEPTIGMLPEGLNNSHIEDGDTVLFFNFRADRMRQMTELFIDGELKDKFTQGEKLDVSVFCMTEYDQHFNDRVGVLFPPSQPKNTLGEVVAAAGGKQLRIAESEKYAHVTFFLNGGREEPFVYEDRTVVPSPKVKTFDETPKMSLPKVMEDLTVAIEDKDYDLIVLNVANGDQVGHSGSFDACVEAVEYIDECVGRMVASLNKVGGEMIIIADHGNCEGMVGEDGGVSTAHTLFPVPFIYKGRTGYVAENGSLADVAPTVLSLMGLDVPKEMTGKVLLSEGV